MSCLWILHRTVTHAGEQGLTVHVKHILMSWMCDCLNQLTDCGHFCRLHVLNPPSHHSSLLLSCKSPPSQRGFRQQDAGLMPVFPLLGSQHYNIQHIGHQPIPSILNIASTYTQVHTLYRCPCKSARVPPLHILQTRACHVSPTCLHCPFLHGAFSSKLCMPTPYLHCFVFVALALQTLTQVAGITGQADHAAWLFAPLVSPTP